MINRLHNIVTIALILGFSMQSGSGLGKTTVKGRVVDSHRRPIVGAQVFIHPLAPPGDLTTFAQTDAEGRFYYEVVDSAYSNKQIAYVSSPSPEAAYIPFYPPYSDELKKTDSAFRGRRILLKKNEETDVGDLLVQVRYALVNVHISSRTGKPLLIDSKSWLDLWLRVRGVRGKVISEGGLSSDTIRRTVDLDRSTLTLALPEGTWGIEIAPDGQEGPWFTADRSLKVHSGGSPLDVTVEIPPP